jgi:hypothetical protein
LSIYDTSNLIHISRRVTVSKIEKARRRLIHLDRLIALKSVARNKDAEVRLQGCWRMESI